MYRSGQYVHVQVEKILKKGGKWERGQVNP